MSIDRFPVESGAILLFARAISDPNPIYSDPDYASGTEVGGIIAPPTFVQSSAHFDPQYPLRPHPGRAWFGSGRNPTGLEASATGDRPSDNALHAEQEFTYHRHLRPGDVLSVRTHPGREWIKQGRSGVLVFFESITEFRDGEGELVVTSRSVGVRTEPSTKDAE